MSEGHLVVIATGGTIASRRSPDGSSAPVLAGSALLHGLADGDDVRVVDALAADSATFTLADMQHVVDEVARAVGDDDARGVLVLHGTDSLEETSLLAAIQVGVPRVPVVFTGAQFTADHPASDGPDNLRTALAATRAAHPGVWVAFGGRVLSTWGLSKLSTDRADAFGHARADAAAAPHLPGDVSRLRVDVVALPPGADDLHVRASLAAGADGLVLEALGSGNTTPTVVAAVRDAVAGGTPVIVSSRVPRGFLVPSYGGGGGGADLAEAGALHSPTLRPGQARILLAALLSTGADRDLIAAAVAGRAPVQPLGASTASSI
ncbi:asparaginase domain-containing protein [Microbacterium binotii]|uniref:asparaginase domain-containing protein n=1 Tax=Microbacterium binotii TaxID=462710 RepID=UPI001F26BF5C|nr:asparaginase domain-containing protein [Microbacterium binotii]UIN31979.1 asparaginase domain-containing protein [Microbacterium binotii]